jgi:hypothetical protein
MAQPKTFVETISELWELLVEYAKQQTVVPIKGVFRFIGFGAAAMFLFGFAFVLFSLAGLRFMQEKTDGHLSGNLSWIPYLVSLAILLAGIGLAYTRIKPKRPTVVSSRPDPSQTNTRGGAR